MFSAFHTQVILGIFFSGWKGESRLHSRSVCACVYVTLQVCVCNCVSTVGVRAPVHVHILQSSDTASHTDRYGSQQLYALLTQSDGGKVIG